MRTKTTHKEDKVQNKSAQKSPKKAPQLKKPKKTKGRLFSILSSLFSLSLVT